MNRLHAVWIIAVLAAGVCTFGLWTSADTEQTISGQIEQVAAEIKNGDIPKAYAYSCKAVQQWQGYHRVLCLFLSHKELDNIGREFEKLPAMLSEGETTQASLQCVQLLSYIHQLRTSEVPLVENIL